MEITEATAGEQIKAAERVLREIFAGQLLRIHGESWEDSLSRRVQEELERIRDSERKARPGRLDEPNLLGYAGFDQLKGVAQHHWDCCVGTLSVWQSASLAQLELDRLHTVRNPAQHGRTLFPHEYVEGEGLARRLRLEVEQIRRQTEMGDDKYWLYVEEAEDSLGNRAANSGGQSNLSVSSGTILRVADMVELRIRAFDPHGRQIAYRLVEPGAPERKREWQRSSEFQWTAWKTSRKAVVDIEVHADGEPLEDSSNEWDTFARFTYEVRPAQWRAEA
jgi:hypothetical protein